MGGTKNGKDVAQAVIEVAWTTLNQQEEMDLKNRLATEQVEHQKLRERFLVYKKIVEDQLKMGGQNVVDTTNQSDLASEACEPSWMELNSTTPDQDMCDRLKDKLASPEFLKQLTTNGNTASSNVLPPTDTTALPKEEQDGLGTSEGYMLITDEDIVEGVAAFVAKLISTIPQSKNMTPEDLQQGITTTFSELRKAGKLQQLWSCMHILHKTASWGSTALELYRNPVILRAAGIAVYTSCSIILSLFT